MHSRPEQPADIETIGPLTAAAFDPMPFGDGDETECIAALRRDGDLSLSLVAIDRDTLVGHDAFSPVTIDGVAGGWCGLGPISVWPHRQRKGIGSRLVRDGLDRLRRLGAVGCLLIEDPACYSRFGFISDGRLTHPGYANDVVQWLTLDGSLPRGVLRFSPGLEPEDRGRRA